LYQLRFRVSAYIAGLALACAATGFAQQYSFQYYGVDQGLTDLAVRALYQDSRGFLWLATENGVFRYDGERFQPFGPDDGLPASNAAVFGEAPDGSLLVGGKFGLYRKAGTDKRFAQIPMPGATRVMWGAGIQTDGRGTTYVATDAGLMLMTRTPGTTQLRLRLPDAPPHNGSPAANSVMVENGDAWWGCGDEICRTSGDEKTVFGPSSGIPAGQWQGIKRAGSGDLWVQKAGGYVAVMRRGTNRFKRANLPLLAGFGPRGLIKLDTEGKVIIPLDDGVLIEDKGHWQKVNRAAGIRGPVYSVLQDREGSVWLGLAGHGLAKWLGYGDWQYFNSDSGLGSDLAYEVAPAGNGAFWAGTDAGLFLGRRTAAGWAWTRQSQLGDLPIHSVRPDGHGKIWLGTEVKGAARLDPQTGAVEWFGKPQGLNAENPYTIMLDRRNRVWAASTTGLFVADLRTLHFEPADGIPAGAFCLAVVEAANGDIWAGTNSGLYQLSSGHWSRFTTAQGLSNNEVLSLAADGNGDIWVGYQFGDQIDRIHHGMGGLAVTRERGGPTGTKGTTYFLGFDANRRLWAGTNRGVDVRNGEALSGAEWEHYDHHDGLVWDDCDLNGFLANPDGTVWLGTSGGLALFTPRATVARRNPPVAILTKLTLRKQVVDGERSVSVDHTMNSLTARFSALTFARENAVMFRYRLAPLFTEWRETSERELEFPGLPANQYRLEVQARDGWGTWSTESASFSFEIRPSFRNAWWFIALCMALLLGLAVLAIRLRGKAMRRREDVLRRLVDERTVELKHVNRDLEETTSQLQAANENLLHLSMVDGLTGISNRRVFDQTLEKEWGSASCSGMALSVILADIDYFKRLNDASGHQTGDECLRLVAGMLAEAGKRDADCIARYGGEEFAILLPGADANQARALAEKVRRAVEKLAFPHPDSGVSGTVTISLGIATFNGANYATAHALVSAADAGLYAAKHQGRNRAVACGADLCPMESGASHDLESLLRAQVPEPSTV
jgi:diguanylate cyclase (GGDEF)-like protein